MRSSNRPGQSIVLGLIIVGLLALALGGYFSPLSKYITQPFIDAQSWITTRYLAVRDILSAPEEIADLRQKNQELEAEIASLQTQNLSLEQQVSEVEILSALLDFARAQPQNEYKAASVISRDPRPFLQYIIINRGSDEGILRGMPVVTAEGLVGRVAAVTANAARIQLVTDPASVVNVKVQPSDTEAVLKGSITSDLTLDFISQDAAIESGNFLLTSGLGGNFPPNILIGQIASVRKESTALFQQASIQSAVDFSGIEIVLIIVNFNPIDISPILPEGVTP